jgi:sortase A
MRWLDKLQRSLLIVGILMLGVYLGAGIHRFALSRAEVWRFTSQQADREKGPANVGLTTRKPDFSQWSVKRIHDYEESLAAQFSPATALLRIPKIDLEVPVFVGTDDLTLNRGVGLIEGTALPGEEGNIGIAGHRDGFFRGLKDVRQGDTVELTTQEQTFTFVIDGIAVVEPSDTSVLSQREHPSLTLVTCYPFYFIGNAPKRYIVQASLIDSKSASSVAVKTTNSNLEKTK